MKTQTQIAFPKLAAGGPDTAAYGKQQAILLREAYANAALIAAAPDLLMALREMLAVSLRVDDMAWADAVGEGKGIGPCDKARAAIARAEGTEVAA